MKKALLLLICGLSFTGLFAQDLIYTADEQILKVDVIEVGVNEIRYYKYKDESGVVYAIAKSDVVKLKMEDGEEIFFTEKAFNPKFYHSQKTKVIKIAPFSPLFGHLGLGYEQMIKPGLNYEVQLGIIGAGFQPGDISKSLGVFAGGGIKLNFKKDYYIDGMRYYHVMQSWYVRFDAVVSHFKVKEFSTEFNTSQGSVALTINLGKQWVLGERMTLDIYGGFGYAGTWGGGFFGNYYFSHLAFRDPPISLTSGVKIGYLLK